MYLYGVSLGGNILMHYMLNDAANVPYSAVVTYGTPFCPEEAIDHFKNAAYGMYDMGLGFHVNH